MLWSSRKIIISIIILLILLGYGFCHFVYADLDVDESKIGIVVDEFNGVKVYYNGSISNVSGQFHNGSPTKPQVDDIIIFDWSKYGHVAIISKVTDNEIEIVQQNPGPTARSRANFPLIFRDGGWKIDSFRVLGYLRKR